MAASNESDSGIKSVRDLRGRDPKSNGKLHGSPEVARLLLPRGRAFIAVVARETANVHSPGTDGTALISSPSISARITEVPAEHRIELLLGLLDRNVRLLLDLVPLRRLAVGVFNDSVEVHPSAIVKLNLALDDFLCVTVGGEDTSGFLLELLDHAGVDTPGPQFLDAALATQEGLEVGQIATLDDAQKTHRGGLPDWPGLNWFARDGNSPFEFMGTPAPQVQTSALASAAQPLMGEPFPR